MEKYFSKLKTRDFWNGLIVFVLTAALYGLQEWLPIAEGVNPTVKAALAAIVGYLLKNVFTGQEAKEKAAVDTLMNSKDVLVDAKAGKVQLFVDEKYLSHVDKNS